jgi:DNA-binding transcriptional LysR family regulator
MNWDDLKILLALSRSGSTRSAAKRLGVSNTTVSRRLESLEEAIGGRLFDRTPDGFKITALGEQLLRTALEIEEVIYDSTLKLTGKDDELEGRIRVSLPDGPFPLIVGAFARFAQKHPLIQLDIATSNEPADLARREADIAIRVIESTGRLPKDIVGIKLGPVSFGYYVHTDLLTASEDPDSALTLIEDPVNRNYTDTPSFANALKLPTRHAIQGLEQQYIAVTHKMGVANLPCIMCSDNPQLTLLPGTTSKHIGFCWLLYHRDLRQSARIRVLFQELASLKTDWARAWDTSETAAISASLQRV